MFNILDKFFLAFNGLRDNKLRTSLSILGISIGVAAVILLNSISEGGNKMVFSELETFGLNTIWISREFEEKNPNVIQRKGTGISNYDYQLLVSFCCESIEAISPIVKRITFEVINRKNNYSNAEIKGVGKSFLEIENDKLMFGRFFRNEEIIGGQYLAVLGPTSANDLFGNVASAIGQEFKIGGRKYLVIGVLKEKNRELLSSIGSGGEDSNNRILLPYINVQKKNNNSEINYIQAKSTSLDQAESASNKLVALLQRITKNRFSYRAQTMSGYVETANRILGGVSIIGILAASISLLVGGMGIMNIMSTAVLERTREIGIRKAIGATNNDVLVQFLVEAISISLIGGFIGVCLGFLLSFLGIYILGFPNVPSLQIALGALVVTIFIGIFSGYVPAKRAADMNPVDALSYD